VIPTFSYSFTKGEPFDESRSVGGQHHQWWKQNGHFHARRPSIAGKDCDRLGRAKRRERTHSAKLFRFAM
jgi:hypothetical protein